MMHPDAAEQ